jgi:hypothetical protein
MGDGDVDGDVNNAAQNRKQLLGKMLRIDVNTNQTYLIPPDNPFVSTPGYKKEIWALGLRNPWRWSFDRLTGEMWLPDVGEDSLEEINLQPGGDSGGENYGWRCYEGSAPFNTTGCGNVNNYTFPIYEYSHDDGDCSAIGGYVYRGEMFPNMYGKYFYLDYCTGKFNMLSYDGSWQNNLLGDFADNTLVSFGESTSGELYIASYFEGKIYHVIDTSSSFAAKGWSTSGDRRIMIYPNPSDGTFYFRYQSSENAKAEINVLDLTGKVLKQISTEIHSGYNQLAISEDLPSGEYIIVLKSSSEFVQQKLVVIK